MDAPSDKPPPQDEVRRIDVAARVDPVASALRCPFCHDPVRLELPTPWVACAACLARHHRSCWDESKRCGACGHALRLRPETSRVGVVALLGAALAGVFLTLLAAVPVLAWRDFERVRHPHVDVPGPATPVVVAAPAAPAAVNGPDLTHVRLGQRYVYEMQNAMQQVWTVREVGPDFVKYDFAMLLAGQPLGDPTAQEWRYYPAPEGTASTPSPDVKLSRERVVVSGIEFDCLVSEASGYRSWSTMTAGSDTLWTFPGILKTVQLSDGATIMGLVKVEQP
jgi:hypothetical protein